MVGRVMSMKKSSDTIGIQTNDLPVCSSVLQPAEPPRDKVLAGCSTDLKRENCRRIK